jgi:chromosome segregation ATPase
MADPLSVAGLTAGLVSLGLQVSGGITQYIDALDCREKDIASAKQQNDSLHKTLQTIEASLVQLRRDHHAATTAVQACLDSCQTELKDLQKLVAELAVPNQPVIDRRSKIRNRGKKLLYPFDRPKLQQLETRLRNANATLQLALQALGL